MTCLNYVMHFWTAELLCPTRMAIVDRIKDEQPHLRHGKLDLEVAGYLNHLVGSGVVQRTGGKYYKPGKQYLELVNA